MATKQNMYVGIKSEMENISDRIDAAVTILKEKEDKSKMINH